ncbi:MAG TPA: hypothetical protein VHB48_01375 [Chitinophagaceae bacterium]|nr:hypothetical protein [Chitinophagaceae bacterium]
MSSFLLNTTVVAGTFIAMEGVAWATHKYIMHGLLWFLHRDHHNPEHKAGFFERNDFFFLIFAIPGIICLLWGLYHPSVIVLCAGIGITLYGACYFFVHDIFIHQRFKVLRNTQHWYFKAIRRAHKMHHKHLGKEDGECFGMLWVPFKYFTNAMRK